MVRLRRIRHPDARPIGTYNVLRDLERAQPAALRIPANTNRATGSKSVVTPFRRAAIDIPRPHQVITAPSAPILTAGIAAEPEMVRPTPLAAGSSLLLRPLPSTPVRPATVLQWQFRPQSRRQELVLVAR